MAFGYLYCADDAATSIVLGSDLRSGYRRFIRRSYDRRSFVSWMSWSTFLSSPAGKWLVESLQTDMGREEGQSSRPQRLGEIAEAPKARGVVDREEAQQKTWGNCRGLGTVESLVLQRRGLQRSRLCLQTVEISRFLVRLKKRVAGMDRCRWRKSGSWNATR